MKKTLCFIFLVALANIIEAEVDIGGFADVYTAAKTKNGKYNANYSRLRLEFSSELNGVYFFGSLNAEKKQNEESKLNLHEAYVEYIGEKYDIRLGKQIVTWGKADGVRITDVLNPADYSMFITGEFDDLRIPINMVKFRYLPGFADFEIIAIPGFEPRTAPKKGSAWFVERQSKYKAASETDNLPKKSLKNAEIAAKVSFFMSGFDFAISSMYLTDDEPVYKLYNNMLYQKFNRSVFVGFEASKVLGEFVARAEVAGYKDKALQAEYDYVKKNYVKAMLGCDWYVNSDFTLSAQFANNSILDYEDEINADEHNTISTLNVSYKMLNQTVELSNMTYYSFNDEDVYNKAEADYAFTDDLHILVGYDYFDGKKGVYGVYKNNSQLWLKAKFNF